MMKRPMIILLAGLAAAVLAGCGEKDQTLGSSAYNKSDGKPWQGAKNSFVAQGWTPGDKGAWETQMRNRAQTQNEYMKAN